MDKQTIDTYNQLAKEYDEETTYFWDEFPREYIKTFAEQVGKGKVLNVGSGPGRDGLLLKESGLAVVCLDASSTMVELSARRGLETVLGDFLNLPFDDESFAGVWAYTSLLHIPKAEVGRSLMEIHRVLKPGGVFGLGLIEGDAEMYRESSGVKQPRWFSYYSQVEVASLLKQYGFEISHEGNFHPKTRNYLHFISNKSN